MSARESCAARAPLLALARYGAGGPRPPGRLEDETAELRRLLRQHTLKLGEHARAMPDTADLASQISGLTRALDQCADELQRTRRLLTR